MFHLLLLAPTALLANLPSAEPARRTFTLSFISLSFQIYLKYIKVYGFEDNLEYPYEGGIA